MAPLHLQFLTTTVVVNKYSNTYYHTSLEVVHCALNL